MKEPRRQWSKQYSHSKQRKGTKEVQVIKRGVDPHQSIKLWLVLRSDSVNILGDLYACIFFHDSHHNRWLNS
jgi:hypothetical protein